MRSVSGILNRIVLAVCGLLITAAALWVVASGISLDQSWPTLSSVLAKADTRVGTWAGPHAHWLLPAAALGSVLLIAFGLVLLIKQVPRKAAASPLRLTGSDGTLLATLSPDVIAQALSERAENVPGVQRCSVWVTGSPSNLWVQATVTVAENSEVAWTVSELRNRLDHDVSSSLGKHARQIDVLLRLEQATKPQSAAHAVAGKHSLESGGSDNHDR